jgi:hypothetical protein
VIGLPRTDPRSIGSSAAEHRLKGNRNVYDEISADKLAFDGRMRSRI